MRSGRWDRCSKPHAHPLLCPSQNLLFTVALHETPRQGTKEKELEPANTVEEPGVTQDQSPGHALLGNQGPDTWVIRPPQRSVTCYPKASRGYSH